MRDLYQIILEPWARMLNANQEGELQAVSAKRLFEQWTECLRQLPELAPDSVALLSLYALTGVPRKKSRRKKPAVRATKTLVSWMLTDALRFVMEQAVQGRL